MSFDDLPEVTAYFEAVQDEHADALMTLDTLIDLVDAVGLELDIRIKRQPLKRNGDYSPLKIQAAV